MIYTLRVNETIGLLYYDYSVLKCRPTPIPVPFIRPNQKVLTDLGYLSISIHDALTGKYPMQAARQLRCFRNAK